MGSRLRVFAWEPGKEALTVPGAFAGADLQLFIRLTGFLWVYRETEFGSYDRL